MSWRLCLSNNEEKKLQPLKSRDAVVVRDNIVGVMVESIVEVER